jgi:hypothetical protein
MQHSLAVSRAELGAKKSDEAWAEGLAMNLQQAADYALGG